MKTGTDLIKHLGELAFATRLKRLSEALQADVGKTYQDMQIEFESKWFTILYSLYHNGAMSINQLAINLKLTHPAIIQFSEQMKKQKLIIMQRDKKDARKKILNLSEKGRQTFENIKPILKEIEMANREFIYETGFDVLLIIEKMEAMLDKKPMYERIKERIHQSIQRETDIISYRPQFKKYFKQLNEEWINRYFILEGIEKKILNQPEKEIIEKGGEIFFAQYKGEIIGTCAVKIHSNQHFELTKMAVTASFQGKGISKLLLKESIRFAKKKGAPYMELEVSPMLKTAIQLFTKSGFKVVTTMHSERFESARIKMKLDLNKHL